MYSRERSDRLKETGWTRCRFRFRDEIVKQQILEQCQRLFPSWRGHGVDDFEFTDPKGFSSFTMTVTARVEVDPPAVFYRHLEGKENAILDFEAEREVFLLLGQHEIAARCHDYGDSYRIEACYTGRTLVPDDLSNPEILAGIAGELYRFHQLRPENLPKGSFFELLHEKWGRLAREVLLNQRKNFPDHEQAMCEDLLEITRPETLEKVKNALPEGPLTFCHNDTYHGNVMKLENGGIKLLDFEFSCLNHKAFDFANLFAETVMRHGLPDDPYFAIAEPGFTAEDIGVLIDLYLEHADFSSSAERAEEHQGLLRQTQEMIRFSDFMYAMAAIPLAVDPIQKIRFIPYAHARFRRFLNAFEEGSG